MSPVLTNWCATEPQGMAGAVARPCTRARLHQHTQKHSQTAIAFAKPAGFSAMYGTGVSNATVRPEGLRGSTG